MKRPFKFDQLAEMSLGNRGINEGVALRIIRAKGEELQTVLNEANKVRVRVFGNTVSLCSILNVKSGGCSEDCAFCAQSARYKTGAPLYPFVSEKKMREYGHRAKALKSHLGLITSGKDVLRGQAFERLLGEIKHLKRTCEIHASLGEMDLESARKLKQAGVTTYHHNIETAPSFFSRVIRTHSFADRLRTIRNARTAGLKVCCGGIVGLGESPAQRVELAFTLRRIAPDRIPLNFLNPIPGTPLGSRKPMAPLTALLTTALFRLVNPFADLRICGGREKVLGELHPLVFWAGASGIMTGDYLTTQGRKPEDDLKMIRDLGLKVKREA